MSKLMLIVGILLTAAGVAVGLMVFFSPGSMQVLGITAEVAAVLLAGGLLAIGQGGIIGAVDGMGQGARAEAAPVRSAPAAPAAAEASATAPAAEEPLSPAVKDTIRALEQAKTDLQQAFDTKPEAPPATAEEPREVAAAAIEEAPVSVPEEAVPEEAVPEEEAAESADADGQLYVVEERMIRNRPARILSDGTVEAETAEGWMRFENLEHLDEYLDAMEPAR